MTARWSPRFPRGFRPRGFRPRGFRPRGYTLRTRVTVVAGLGITAAVVLGLLLMYLLQMGAVRRTIDGQLRTYATQIAQSAHNGTWPAPLPRSSLDPNAQAQVITADGRVLAATRTLAGLPAIYRLPANSATPVRQKAADGVIPDEVGVIGLRATVGGRPVTIITSTPTGLLGQVNAEFARHLLIGIPVILVLAAAAVWLVVGRALRPVERIRHAVTDITSADLSQRVPEPGTADEIGHLAYTMNDMLARLEDAARRQRRFVADASHELRSPLAAIRTTLEIGLAYPDRAPWPVIADRAVQQSARLEDLIQQLLVLAKADERKLTAPRHQVDIGTVLNTASSSTVAPHLDIDLDIAPGTASVGNAGDLERLFRNVIENAVRYARSRVRITATSTGDAVRVEVDDDGPGIPAADHDRVFDRFVRLDSSRERGSGTTGLGLAIAREIALAHRGHIAIADSPSGGARVIIILPLATTGAPP